MEKSRKNEPYHFCIGRVLHVCCGKSKFGDVRTDLYPQDRGVKWADYRHLPFHDLSFDTVLFNPPPAREHLEERQDWLDELARVARKRIFIVHENIFTIPGFRYGFAYAQDGKGLTAKIITVYDREGGRE